MARTLGMPPLRQIGALVVHHARAPPNADCKPSAYMGLQSPVSGEMSRADETGQAVSANST